MSSMKTVYTLFIVDDHPMTVDGYENLLSEVDDSQYEFSFIKAYDCKTAFNKINEYVALNKTIDLALLDINLPEYVEHNIFSGVELANYLKKKFPDCKLVLLSMRNEPLLIDKIIKNLNPEGFISKNDINFEQFPIICKNIIHGETFQSKTINEARRELFKININWDVHDSQIILLLSEGVKTINLPEYIPLSMSAIEKRKANIKAQLINGSGNDKELIQTAKKLGLI
jgi:DNA-binding NarL/FixJ family response regulator